MAMEDMWNLRASLNRPPGQPSPGPSTLNQFGMDPGQLSQPYVAQEVCVIERTISQERVTPNLMNFGSQGLTPNELRSELLALVSGIQQPAHRQSYLPSMNSRSSFMAPYPLSSHMNATDSAGLSGWPSMSPPNVLQTNRLNWIGNATAGADAQQSGRGRDSSVAISGRVHENSSSNGLRTPVSATLKQSLGVLSGTQDHGVDVNRQSPSPQWLTDNRRQKHHAQGAQTTHLLSAKPDLHRTETIPSNIGSGFPGHPHSRPRSASPGRLRVFCPNYTTGTSLGGELCLTDTGRLGIICSCHSAHLSVSRFTQHAGVHNMNAGEAVFMEDGETLVRWRKAFFSQYGVKVPEDNVGWDWLDADSMETGQENYKAVMTQSWQKEVNVSYGGNTPMVKSRTTQVWDASLANGINPTLHAMQSISNTKFAPLNTGHGGIPISRDSLLRNFGMDCKGGTLTPDLGSTHTYAETLRQNFTRSPGNTVSSASLQSSSCLGVMPLSNEFNFINDGLHRFLSPSQQRASATKNLDDPNHSSNRWGLGQEPCLKENDTSSSNFELRLGQPSQQSQPAGPSFSSMPALRVEHPKSNLLEHMMSKVWDGRLQHDPQQFNLAELPRFSGIPGQAREQAVATTSGRTDYERTSYMETTRMKGQNAEQDRNFSNLIQPQSTTQKSNLLQTASKPSMAGKSEAKLPSLDHGPQVNELSSIGAWKFQTGQTDQLLLDKTALRFAPHTDHSKRSVALENGTALDSINSGALLHPSKKTEQRLLETAIKSSLGYEATGLESVAVKENDGLTKRVLGVNLPGDLAAYRRPSYPLEALVPSFTVRKDHSGPMFEPNRVLDRDNVGQLQHLPNGATHMQEHQGVSFNHLSVHKSAIAESSHMHDEYKSRRLAQPPSEELQDWSRSISEKHRQIHESQLIVNKKQSWSQNAPDSDTIIDSRMGLKVRDSEDQSSELLGGQTHQANGAGHEGLCRQPLPDLENRDPKSGPEQDRPTQDVPDLSTKDREDIHCPCYRCRKASPSTTGRAVPRLAGQVCLKDVEGQGSKMEPSKKSTQGDSVSNPSRDSTHFNEELKSNELSPDMNPDILVKSGNSTGTLRGQLLPMDGAQEMCEQHNEKLEDSVQSDPLITGKEDLLSDTAAKGISVVTDSSHIAKAVSDICSKSSENILSGISDEGCDNNGGEEALHVQSIPKIPETGALDEDSGIGKCCSSDGVDMGVAPTPNPVSALEDPSKQNSPSSLGGPSSSSAGNRLIMKKCGIRSTGGSQMSKEPAQDDLRPEAVLSAGKLEKKRRRALKWTQLDSDEGAGEPKKGSLVTNSGHTDGPVTSVDKSEVGTKMRKSEARSDQGVEDTGVSAKTSEETIPLFKCRKIVVTSERSSAPEAKTPECTENRTMVGGDGEQRKGRTLVIRVPQGVNRQKANRANRTDSSPNTGVAESKLDLCEEACLPKSGATKGPACGDSPSTEGAPVNRKLSSCEVANTALARPEEVPTFLTKSLRSARTPRGGPSPRSGRMMSLSAILKQPRESRINSNNKAGHKQDQKLNTDASTSNLQGKIHKKIDASVAFVATPTKVTDFSLPEMESPWREEGKSRVLSKEDAQKVRRLGEVTGKAKMHGPGTEVFDFAEEGTEILRADKQGKATVQTADSTQNDSTVKTYFPIPKSGRSARSFPCKRNVEWHRSKDAQADPGKSGSEAVVAEKNIPQKKRTGLSYSLQLPAGSTNIPRVDLHPNSVQQVSLVRKKVRSSTVKRPQTVPRHFETEDRDLNGRVENRDSAANTEAARHVQSRPIFGASTALKKRLPDYLDKVETSSKRPKMMGGSKKTSCSGEHHSNNEFAIQRVVHGHPLGKFTIYKKGKLPLCEEENISVRKQKKLMGGSDTNKFGVAEKSKCDVCGTFTSVTFNKLLSCSRCPVKVHQACYGVSKIPKGPWSCRTCKFRVVNPVCVLCGYSGGAMTRVRKARGFGHGLLQAWQDLDKDRVVLSEFPPDEDNETLLSATISIQSSKNCLSACIKEKHPKDRLPTVINSEICSCNRSKVDGSSCKTCVREDPKAWRSADLLHKKGLQEDWKSNNTVTALLKDAGAKQWAHIVCSLWLPGTRCLNVGTMGVFDVSGVAISRRKSLCTICLRKGGACIQCRVPQCSAVFHVWCAHEKGLLQSEIIQDGTNQVGFFGKCLLHASFSGVELEAIMNKMSRAATSLQTCARTEGYKGRQTLEERAKSQLQMTLEGSTAVTPQQVATWLRINDRKSSTRRFIKPANSVMKYDHRFLSQHLHQVSDKLQEYLRFKQKKGWRRLTVYKSGIHALGLYTMEFIAEGEVVVEYIGEIIGLRVADKREAEYHSGKRLQHQGACYLFRIDTERIIDATRKGGIARYVNHSCSPNCVAKVICVDNLKKVIFFAKRDIYAGEEVTYDYKFNYDEVGDKIPCFCGCSNCRGTLN